MEKDYEFKPGDNAWGIGPVLAEKWVVGEKPIKISSVVIRDMGGGEHVSTPNYQDSNGEEQILLPAWYRMFDSKEAAQVECDQLNDVASKREFEPGGKVWRISQTFNIIHKPCGFCSDREEIEGDNGHTIRCPECEYGQANHMWFVSKNPTVISSIVIRPYPVDCREIEELRIKNNGVIKNRAPLVTYNYWDAVGDEAAIIEANGEMFMSKKAAQAECDKRNKELTGGDVCHQ